MITSFDKSLLEQMIGILHLTNNDNLKHLMVYIKYLYMFILCLETMLVYSLLMRGFHFEVSTLKSLEECA